MRVLVADDAADTGSSLIESIYATWASTFGLVKRFNAVIETYKARIAELRTLEARRAEFVASGNGVSDNDIQRCNGTSTGPAETNTGIAQEPLTPDQRMYCWNATVGAAIGVAIGVMIGFPLLMPGMLAGTIIGGLVGMSVVLNAPMPGMPPTDLMTKFIRCQQGMSPFGG
ncbi:hypothetical protein [Nocardia sp. NPDC051570]|uniref:hypothetical protein n=1 Tax=Nocardia sp. NPDC051570 TaxID=3364324 RepID=UPI00378D13FF